MMIDKIRGVQPLETLQRTESVAPKGRIPSDSDSISVSAEARELAQEMYLQEVADETPDVRSDLVAQIKEKIKDPNYINNAVLASTADRIMMSYGL